MEIPKEVAFPKVPWVCRIIEFKVEPSCSCKKLLCSRSSLVDFFLPKSCETTCYSVLVLLHVAAAFGIDTRKYTQSVCWRQSKKRKQLSLSLIKTHFQVSLVVVNFSSSRVKPRPCLSYKLERSSPPFKSFIERKAAVSTCF